MCIYHVGFKMTLMCSAYQMDLVAIMLTAKQYLTEVSESLFHHFLPVIFSLFLVLNQQKLISSPFFSADFPIQ